MKASTIIGGASKKHGRVESDYYATPAACTQALIRYMPLGFWGDTIWEPACGTGDMARVYAHEFPESTVLATDLENRGYGLPGVDFTKTARLPGVTSIVTNPPFRLAADFIRHCRAMGVPFAMLLKSTYWNVAERTDLFYETGPILRLDLTWRPAMAPERGKSATMDFTWTIWDRKPALRCQYDLLQKPP